MKKEGKKSQSKMYLLLLDVVCWLLLIMPEPFEELDELRIAHLENAKEEDYPLAPIPHSSKVAP